MSPISVSDSLSNTNEQIEQAVKAIGRSESNRLVYVAIYRGKRAIKTVSQIAESTGLRRKQVLTSGKRLYDRQIVEQTKQNGETAYRKIQFFYTHRSKILTLVKHRKAGAVSDKTEDSSNDRYSPVDEERGRRADNDR